MTWLVKIKKKPDALFARFAARPPSLNFWYFVWTTLNSDKHVIRQRENKKTGCVSHTKWRRFAAAFGNGIKIPLLFVFRKKSNRVNANQRARREIWAFYGDVGFRPMIFVSGIVFGHSKSQLACVFDEWLDAIWFWMLNARRAKIALKPRRQRFTHSTTIRKSMYCKRKVWLLIHSNWNYREKLKNREVNSYFSLLELIHLHKQTESRES